MRRVWWGVLIPAALAAQGQVLTFHSEIDNSDQPYAVSTPKSFAPGQKYPLVISLHSEDTNHRINLRQVLGLGPDQPTRPREPEMVIACPLARGTMGYRGIPEQDVYDVLADAERRFPIDEDRVYLTGISMGGDGALRLALTRPDVWAAVAVMCPTPDAASAPLAGNALDLPVRLYHGDQDPIAPVETSRLWQRRLLDAGAPAEYMEYPSVRHNVWMLAYRGGAVFEWFARFRRNRFPERVHITTDSYRYASAYWVRIDGLTPGTPAAVDAKREGSAVAVQTSGVRGFTLTLDRPVSLATIDGQTLRLRPAAAHSFVRQGARWRAGLCPPGPKRRGAEGPIVEAVSGRQIYVYGTVDEAGRPVSAEEQARRKKIAESAAAWSTEASRLMLSLPVEADRDVTDSDLATADLVLFGNRDSNSVIARLAPELPISLNPGAADYGLVFIAPAGGRAVLICSGLPWWTGADMAHRSGWPFAPQQLRLLSSFGDYILFKGSLANVVAEGQFDDNWKLPAEAGAKLAASGTVNIR